MRRYYILHAVSDYEGESPDVEEMKESYMFMYHQHYGGRRENSLDLDTLMKARTAVVVALRKTDPERKIPQTRNIFPANEHLQTYVGELRIPGLVACVGFTSQNSHCRLGRALVATVPAAPVCCASSGAIFSLSLRCRRPPKKAASYRGRTHKA